MNKRAGERVLSIYLFIIYIIVGIGIVSGVIIFYGSPSDIRELEAGILTDKVIDCLVKQGELNEEVLKKDFDLVNFCKFDFRDNSKKYGGEEQYGVRIKLYDFDTCSKNDEGVLFCMGEAWTIPEAFGRKDFLEFCGSGGDKIPKCDLKEVYVLNGDDKVLLSVISAVGKV